MDSYIPNPYRLQAAVGNQFYNREELIQNILHGSNSFVLALGMRRMGKTSLLKHIEWLLEKTPDFGIYIDLEDATREKDVAQKLISACQKSQQVVKKLGYVDEIVRGKTVEELLAKLDALARSRDIRWFLLVDEAEQLVAYSEAFLREFSKGFRACQNLRLILAASQEIYKLNYICQKWQKPFLEGFCIFPLSRISSESATKLIIQSQNDVHVSVSEEDVAEIMRLTDNQPYLIQALCFVLYDGKGGLSSPTSEKVRETFLRANLDDFFSNSYKSHLSKSQKRIIDKVAERDGVTREELKTVLSLSTAKESQILTDLDELIDLGYLREEPGGKVVISNLFFNEWLRRRSREDVYGRMAFYLNHELKYLLAPIQMTAETVLRGVQGTGAAMNNETICELMGAIIQGVKRVESLFRSQFNFFDASLQFEKHDVIQLLSRAARIAYQAVLQENKESGKVGKRESEKTDERRAENEYDIDYKIVAPGEIPHVELDATWMQATFVNLIKNGFQAMKNGGALTIEVRREKQQLKISISDTGEGIPPDVLEQIFEPFFSTKQRGFGIGLFAARTVITRHRGKIDVKSEVGRGTTVEICLPLAQW